MRIATESFLADLSVADPAVITTPLPQHIEALQKADEASVAQVQDLGETQQSVMALESIARSLSNKETAAMGKMGGRFLNIAAEQLMEEGRIPTEALPLNVKEFEVNPEGALSEAAVNIANSVEQAMEVSAQDLTMVVGYLTEKRSALSDTMHAMHRRLDRVKETLETVRTTTGQENRAIPPLGNSSSYNGICYSGKGVVAQGSTVVSDVIHLLAEQSSMYQRLIHSQSEWVRQHKENLLATANGFEQYCFNPAEYLLGGMLFSHRGNGYAVFKSQQLPSSLYAYCAIPEEKSFGYAAVEALLHSKFFLDREPMAAPEDGSEAQVNALTLIEIEAREKELRMGLVKLREWSDCVHSKLWSDALFEEVITTFLLKQKTESMNERAVGWLAAGVVRLLNEATCDIPRLVIPIYDDLLRLMEDSISQYVSGSGQ